jgi:hypothetical protein
MKLIEHGPLTVRGLQSMLLPKISERRLREALGRLEEAGLLSAHDDRIFGGSPKFYRFHRSLKNLERLESAYGLNVQAEDFQVRERERLHSESCAIWTEYFRRSIPGCEVVRENLYQRNARIQSLLLNDGSIFETRPDLVIFLSENVSVAVEIERNRKSTRRLKQKLYRHAAQSRFDGLLYLCTDSDLSEVIRTVYELNVRKRAMRIRQYGLSFLMFGSIELPTSASAPTLHDAAGNERPIEEWIHFLKSTPMNNRRDSALELPATTTC